MNNDKKKIVEYIYDNINLSKYKFMILENENQLQLLSEKKYYTSINFIGYNYFLVFTKIRNNNFSFLIDRKTLNYEYSKINLEMIKTINVKIDINNDIYNGSIFDGSYINNEFMITDVLMFKGENKTLITIDMKLLEIYNYLNKNYNENENDTIKLMINKLYKIEETEKVINKIIPSIKNYKIRGLIFYPEISGTKLLYLFNTKQNNDEHNNDKHNNDKHNNDKYNNDRYNIDRHNNPNKDKYNNDKYNKQINDRNNNQQNMNDEIIIEEQIKKTKKIIYKPKEEYEYTFEIIKGNIIDVYNLNIIEKVEKDNTILLKRKKIGIAYIPTIECSKLCDSITNNKNRSALVNCKFIHELNKWIPIKISNKKKPSHIEEFEIVEL